MNRLLAFVIAASLSSMALSGICASKPGKSWEQVYKAGNLALEKGEYWIAKPTLHESLEIARTFDPSDIRLAKSLSELGRLYTIRGKFSEAEPYLEEALLVKQRALGLDNDEFIPAVGSLCKFYLLYGPIAKADVYGEEVLFLVGGKMKEPIWQNKTKVKLKQGKFLEAWAGVADPMKRSPALDWAITLEELGNLYRLQGNYDYSQRMFDAALDVKSIALGKQHMSLATTHDDMGMLYLAKEDYKAAEESFRDSLEITEKILPPESPEVFSRLDKLARSLMKQGKYKEAEALYLRAQHLWDQQPSRYGEEARAKFALGCLYADEHNYGAAAPVLRRALEMCRRINGPESIAVVPYMKKYAYVLYYIGRRNETDQLKARSQTIAGDIK